MDDITVKVNIITEVCCICGVPFGMPDYLVEKYRTEGGSFYCPNGHGQHYAQPKVDKLKEEVDWYRRKWKDERDDHQSTKHSLRATKAAHTRTKNRVKNGVCPCCKRHFENLHRHMETQHPDYTA